MLLTISSEYATAVEHHGCGIIPTPFQSLKILECFFLYARSFSAREDIYKNKVLQIGLANEQVWKKPMIYSCAIRLTAAEIYKVKLQASQLFLQGC